MKEPGVVLVGGRYVFHFFDVELMIFGKYMLTSNDNLQISIINTPKLYSFKDVTVTSAISYNAVYHLRSASCQFDVSMWLPNDKCLVGLRIAFDACIFIVLV